MKLTFRPVPLQNEPAAALVAAMRAELSALYDQLDIDAPDMPKAGPGELGPPRGVFLVGFDASDRPICCGGVKRLSDDACEIKRMYVVPQARGRGVGRQLLAALENAAVELDYGVIRLDTGPRQPDAERMYRRAGYRPIDNFNANPIASFFGEKLLA
jgi:GNAT superfamily N-acetyltransferase